MQRLQLRRRAGSGVRKRRDPAHAGHALDQNFLPFAVEFGRENADTGGIAVRPRHRFHHAFADHVVGNGEDRHDFGGLLHRAHSNRTADRKDIERTCGQVRRIVGDQIHLRRPSAVFDGKILLFDGLALLLCAPSVSTRYPHQNKYSARDFGPPSF